MPKKRFTSQYSKPQSTVHPSLNTSGASSGSSSSRDAPPSVNDLLSSLRKSQVPADQRAGPAPPPSWNLINDRLGSKKRTKDGLHPHDVNELPGLDAYPKKSRTAEPRASERDERSLQNMCMRLMAVEWEFMREFERNNLAGLPTRLRMQLLSNIAVYGPVEGVGFEGMKSIVDFPEDQDDPGKEESDGHNEDFYRLDLSGSVGRSVSFKQLVELVEKPVEEIRLQSQNDSWDDNLIRTLTPRIPHLTHLSLSHPPSTISWPKFLQFSKYVPTLTHLSLAHWPVPCLTPNSKSTVVSSKFGRDIQYGGTNFYSHSLDNDFSEAASILRRLASTLYDLEYLDITGCTSWIRALLWREDGEPGIDWRSQLLNLRDIKVHSGISLSEDSGSWEVTQYVDAFKEVSLVRLMLTKERRGTKKAGGWIELEGDDYRDYQGLWKGSREETTRKRRLLDSLDNWEKKEQFFNETLLTAGSDHLVRNIWDQ